MMHVYRFVTAAAALCAAVSLRVGAQQTPPQPPPEQPQQQREVVVRIDSAPGLPPRIAVPDFIAATNDAETVAAAKTIGEVLWDDLNFEREFYMVGRDTYKTVPPPSSLEQVPLDRW